MEDVVEVEEEDTVEIEKAVVTVEEEETEEDIEADIEVEEEMAEEMVEATEEEETEKEGTEVVVAVVVIGITMNNEIMILEEVLNPLAVVVELLGVVTANQLTMLKVVMLGDQLLLSKMSQKVVDGEILK